MNYATHQAAHIGQLVGQASPIEPRDPEITRKLVSLEAALSRVEAHTSDLIDRISPITRQEPPAIAAPALVSTDPVTLVGSMINDLIARAESIGERLASVHGRVEL